MRSVASCKGVPMSNLIVRSAKMREAHEMTMLQQARRELADGQKVQRQYRKLVGFDDSEDDEDETVGGVTVADNITNEVHHHHHQPTAAPTADVGKLARAALLGASLLGTGGLGGLAAWWLTRPAPAVQPSTDTRIELGVFSE